MATPFPPSDYTYTVQYLDITPAEAIDYDKVVARLGNYYADIESVMNELHAGTPIRTPFAVYRAYPTVQVQS